VDDAVLYLGCRDCTDASPNVLEITRVSGAGSWGSWRNFQTWYRCPFGHSGSVMTLEDWFDPRRLRDDYVPTGFKGYGIETRAVKGHEFGLKLSAEDKRALIAFLRKLWKSATSHRSWTVVVRGRRLINQSLGDYSV